MVEMRDVSVVYSGGVDALHNVNLKINDGDFAFVVGPSGAGKSTMIKLILKEINPSSGTVFVNGYHLGKLKQRQVPALRRTIGFVFQDFRLIPSMTVYENIAFVLRVIDAPTSYIKKRVAYVIDLVGLQDKAKNYPNELSGGEMQRVLLALALQQEPELLVLDEPSAGVDFQGEHLFCELLDELRAAKGFTQLMVSHDLGMVFHHATHVICLKRHVFAEGTPDEVLTQENLMALFGMHMGLINPHAPTADQPKDHHA